MYGSEVTLDDKPDDGAGRRPEISFKDFLKAAKTVFKEKGYDPDLLNRQEVVNLIKATHAVYKDAIDTGIADNDIPAAMMRKLDHDAFMFSGFKVHHELSEVGLSLRDDKGQVKGYDAFAHDVRKIHDTYNGAYLRAEYDFAVTSAQMAAKWGDVEAGGGRYDLQYRTAGDERVREEHAAMDGITLPADDPFWKSYYPPNGWRCRCTAVEVNRGKYPVSDSKKAMETGDKATTKLDRFGNNTAGIFRFNPGMEGKTFPPKHPYGKVDKGVRKTVETLADKQVKPRLTPAEKDAVYAKPIGQQFDKVYTDKDSGHSVLQHRLVDATAEDYKQVLAVAKAYAKEADCRINPVVMPNAEKGRQKLYPGITDNANPDLRVAPYGFIDVKSPRNKNNIINNANTACKQGSIAIITDLAMKESMSMAEVAKFTERIFSDKNVDQDGSPNYTKNEVHWYIKGKLIKCNRPRKN